MTGAEPEITICIVPRERFSCAVDSLRDIVGNTALPYELVYVDGNSPPDIAAELARICAERGFDYRRVDEYLPPNRARNLALERVETRYAVFVDNDVFVDEGWLTALVDCANETGAWAVTPVVLEGTAGLRVIHIAGGDLVEERSNGYNRISSRHRFVRTPLASVRSRLVREPVGFCEFHCALVRTDVFDRRAFLDEELLAHAEHLDFAREVRRAGGEIYFEPSAVVRHDNARPFEACDREYFDLRWSAEWIEASFQRARRKWELAPDDPMMDRLRAWTATHRRLFEKSRTPYALRFLPLLARRAAGTWLRDRGLLRNRKIARPHHS
jgi:GT2 family glycosyltransferase